MGRSGRSRRRAERKKEEAAKEAARVAAEASASKVSLESNTTTSTDSYVWSGVRDERAAQAANTPSNVSNQSKESDGSNDSYVFSGWRDDIAAGVYAAGPASSLRKRPAQMNLSNPTKQSLNSATPTAPAPQSAVPERTRASYGGGSAQVETADAPRSAVPGGAQAPYGAVSAQLEPPAPAAPAAAPVELPAEALAEVPHETPAMPRIDTHVCNMGQDEDQGEHPQPIVRPGKTEKKGGVADFGPQEYGRLCVDAVKEAIRRGEEKVDATLIKKVMHYYQVQLRDIRTKASQKTGTMSIAMEAIHQKMRNLEKENSRCWILLQNKTHEEGWRHQLDKALEVVEMGQLKAENEMLREENEEVKRNYAELEEAKKTDEDVYELDKELIAQMTEAEKEKDERIKKLEDELCRAKKEVALSGFQSRPKVPSSMQPTASNISTSTVESDESTLNEGTGSNVSNISNASSDTTLSTTNANIHLLEMSMAHSKKNFTEATKAAAKAEKYLASMDAKTQLAVKAWHASNVALSKTGETDSLELAKRLFEDALFIAQGMKNDKGGKAYEDKCKAWLSHLADVEAKRTAGAADSRETSQERPEAETPKNGYAGYEENKCAPQRQDMLWVKKQAQKKAAEAAQADNSSTPRAPSPVLPVLPSPSQTLGQQLEGMQFYSSSASKPSNRSSQELPARPPQPLGAAFDAELDGEDIEGASQRSRSRSLDSCLPPSSPPRRHSSQEWPTKLSRSLADELNGHSSPASPFPFRSRSRSEPRDSESVWRHSIPDGELVVGIDIDDFSPSNVSNIHYASSSEQSPKGSVVEKAEHHDTEARPMSTRSAHFPRLFR